MCYQWTVNLSICIVETSALMMAAVNDVKKHYADESSIRAGNEFDKETHRLLHKSRQGTNIARNCYK